MPDHEDRLEPLAAALADGAAIDWEAAAATAAPDATVDQLRALEKLRHAHGASTKGALDIGPITGRVLEAVLVVTVLDLALAVAGTLVAPLSVRVASTPLASMAYLLLFSGSGLILLWGGRADLRARALGCCYLSIASSSSHRPIEALAAAFAPSWAGLITAMTHATATAAFEPVFFLAFAAGFPAVQQPTGAQRATVATLHAALVAALALVVMNVLIVMPGVPPAVSATAVLFDSTHATYFWQVVGVFWIAALALVLWKARAAPPAERRRAQLLAGGVAVGLAPVLFFSLLIGPLSPIRSHVTVRDLRMIGTYIVYPFLFSIPITTAYAVLVERVLDVRLLVGRAAQYVLARRFVLAATGTPLLVLLAIGWTHRQDLVGGSTSHAWLLLLLTATGTIGWFGRPSLLALVDRLFQHEPHDARTVLAGFAVAARAALGVRDVAATVRAHLARAFHLEDAAVFVRSADGRALTARTGRARALPIDSGLCTLLAAGTSPVVFDRLDDDALVALLSPADRAWLADTGFTVLIPLPASDGGLLGAIALCERRGGIPLSEDNLLLAAALASAAASTLEHRHLSEVGPPLSLPDDVPATECPSCGLVHAADTAVCDCGAPVVGARVPYLLAGKFRAERRLGSGAMGVVYGGLDTALDRPVAIKALPNLTPDQAARLRAEARAMARVAHPNLTVIFALESWRGTPLLIVELLDGGTLAQRLGRGPIEPTRALRIGALLADAVARMHAAGLVHGDIKPSNVGFTLDGIPKLIDFGLARLQVDEAEAGPDLTTPHPGGTPLYLPPEVLAGAPADSATDLWSLNLVLYEAVAGLHPFRRDTPEQTLVAARRGTVPDLRTPLPSAPPNLAEYLRRALARDRARRPASAEEVKEELARILSGEPFTRNGSR